MSALMEPRSYGTTLSGERSLVDEVFIASLRVTYVRKRQK
jgi:hypothetical protein